MPLSDESLGQLVRAAWVQYCHETGQTKPSWLAPWEELGEWDRQVDRRIGQVVADAATVALRAELAALRAVLGELFDYACQVEAVAYTFVLTRPYASLPGAEEDRSLLGERVRALLADAAPEGATP